MPCDWPGQSEILRRRRGAAASWALGLLPLLLLIALLLLPAASDALSLADDGDVEKPPVIREIKDEGKEKKQLTK